MYHVPSACACNRLAGPGQPGFATLNRTIYCFSRCFLSNWVRFGNFTRSNNAFGSYQYRFYKFPTQMDAFSLSFSVRRRLLQKHFLRGLSVRCVTCTHFEKLKTALVFIIIDLKSEGGLSFLQIDPPICIEKFGL